MKFQDTIWCDKGSAFPFSKKVSVLIQIQERVNKSDHFHEHLNSMIDSV